MAFEVVIKKRFINKLVKTLTYLENEWGDKVAEDFLTRVDARISMLKHQPHLGAKSKKAPNIRGLLITKHNLLYYKVDNNKIVILNLYDTRSNPVKNQFD